MNTPLPNPFEVTKASDLSDEQIHDLWVDVSGGHLATLAKPRSPMPMFILGGKGSGKTHLMRHFSYALQKRRASRSCLEQVTNDGYLGLYIRCEDLNPGRFQGKGQPTEAWIEVFSYYMELWAAQHAVEALLDICNGAEGLDAALAEAISRLAAPALSGRTHPSLLSLLHSLRERQQQLDVAVSNAAIKRSLADVGDIALKRGQLLFEIPRAVAVAAPLLARVQILYLIDEFELLEVYQQRYFHSLVRERRGPCSFRIGSRLYGVRTSETLGTGEANKEGAEYEALRLDDILRSNRKYKDFAVALIVKRLAAAGYAQLHAEAPETVARVLGSAFQLRDDAAFVQALAERKPDELRPAMSALTVKLSSAKGTDKARGIRTDQDVARAMQLLKDPDPLLEKVNAYRFYQAWYSRRDLGKAAAAIHKQCTAYKRAPDQPSPVRRLLGHFRSDFVAQLLQEYKQKQAYVGLSTFIDMSHGLPRNLLLILKHVFKWAAFNEEEPFQGGLISVGSQQRGVEDAAFAFYSDARVGALDAELARDAVKNLADLMRDLRFSDKPPESALSTFSASLRGASPNARRVLDAAAQQSLLVAVPRGQRDRNTAGVDYKYQINRMLAPRWDLPIARRGAVALTSREVNAIFDPAFSAEFAPIKRRRIERANAPFSRSTAAEEAQPSLF